MPAFVFARRFSMHTIFFLCILCLLAAPLFYRWFKSIMRFLFKVSWVPIFSIQLQILFHLHSIFTHFFPLLFFTIFIFFSLLLSLQKECKKKFAISLWFLVSFRSKLSLCGLTAAYMLNTMIFLHFFVQTNDSQNPNLYFALFHRCHSCVCFFFLFTFSFHFFVLCFFSRLLLLLLLLHACLNFIITPFYLFWPFISIKLGKTSNLLQFVSQNTE